MICHITTLNSNLQFMLENGLSTSFEKENTKKEAVSLYQESACGEDSPFSNIVGWSAKDTLPEQFYVITSYYLKHINSCSDQHLLDAIYQKLNSFVKTHPEYEDQLPFRYIVEKNFLIL